MIVGIFVGGRGSRMGGVAKGLLHAPGSDATLAGRLRDEARAALPAAELVLVGAAEPYADLRLPALSDVPQNVGPLGGLSGLLTHASQRGAHHVLALACDLPRIERDLLRRLALEEPEAAALLASAGELRNPLIARYRVDSTLAATQAVLARGKRALQAVLDELGAGVRQLDLSDAERATLLDWDTPEDVRRDAH